jgi:hypothetical protein
MKSANKFHILEFDGIFFRFAGRFRMTPNVLQLQEVGDFGDENCLPPLDLIRSTKLHLSTEPAFLPNAC